MPQDAVEESELPQGTTVDDFRLLQSVFPQIEPAVLVEILRDEGSYDRAVSTLLNSITSDGVRSQIENDAQIAQALQVESQWTLSQELAQHRDRWLSNQGESWEGLKQYASEVYDYVSEGISKMTESLNQYISEPESSGQLQEQTE